MQHIHGKLALVLPHVVIISWPKLIDLLSETVLALWQRGKKIVLKYKLVFKAPTGSDTHHHAHLSLAKTLAQTAFHWSRNLHCSRGRQGMSALPQCPICITKPHPHTTSKLETSWISLSYFIFKSGLQMKVPNWLVCKRDISSIKYKFLCKIHWNLSKQVLFSHPLPVFRGQLCARALCWLLSNTWFHFICRTMQCVSDKKALRG